MTTLVVIMPPDKPKDCNPATYYGLHEWHKYMFEKLGWMFLNINKGNQNPEKITSYKNSIDLLLRALDKKITTETGGHKEDLEILKENVTILKTIANNHLKPSISIKGGAKKRKSTKKNTKKTSKKQSRKNSRK